MATDATLLRLRVGPSRGWLAAAGRRSILALIVGFGVGFAGSAAAEPVISVDAVGEASGGGDDLRTRAIDDGFARALDTVLGDELGTATVRRNRDLLQRQVTRRARLYVVSFRVVDQVAGEGTMRVEINTRVDLGKLRAALAQLDLAGSQKPAVRTRPKVVVLLHATLAGATAATFGTGGHPDGGVAGQSFVEALTDLGFEVITAAGKPAAVSRQADGRLPLDRAAALALARAVDAGGAFVVGLEVRDDGTLRGTRLRGAAGGAEVRVYADDGAEVAHAEVDGAGYADVPADAVGAAARLIAGRAVAAIGDRVTGYWPAPRRVGDASAIVIRGARRWATVEAIMTALRASRGVSAVVPRGFGRGEIGLAVTTTLEPARLAGTISNVRVADATITASVRGRRVEVEVAEATEATGEVTP